MSHKYSIQPVFFGFKSNVYFLIKQF